MRAVGFSSAEFGDLNLWFPNSSIEPATATGCRLSLPAASGSRHCRPGSACPTNFGGGLGEREAAAEPPPSGGAEAMPTENPQEIPADSQTSAASAYGGRWSSIEPAAASGRRPCRPGSACYLPTQKLAKISDTTASDASSPVISPSSRRASHSSTAATSSGTPVSMACTARARAA